MPLIVGGSVPEGDQHWKNYLLLLTIADLLFAPEVTEDDVGYLDVILKEHHQQFIKLYTAEKVIPKMHYLLHAYLTLSQGSCVWRPTPG